MSISHLVDRLVPTDTLPWHRGEQLISVTRLRWESDTEWVEVHGVSASGPLVLRVRRADLPSHLRALLD